MARRVIESLIGLVLTGTGIFISLKVDNRGDALVIFFVSLGGFLVSKSLVTEFFKTIWGTIRGQSEV